MSYGYFAVQLHENRVHDAAVRADRARLQAEAPRTGGRVWPRRVLSRLRRRPTVPHAVTLPEPRPEIDLADRPVRQAVDA